MNITDSPSNRQMAPLADVVTSHATSNGGNHVLSSEDANKSVTANDSWLSVAENEAVGGDALKQLEANAASMVMSEEYQQQPPKSVEEATPKLHHHHHHHHHYHHHHHTLKLACDNTQLIKAVVLKFLSKLPNFGLNFEFFDYHQDCIG